ncbi:MAG: hypothetical protein ABL931_16190 [Usitatibacteraceae bacterium]
MRKSTTRTIAEEISAAAPADDTEAAGKATQALEKPAVRRKALAEQSILQKAGADALPVSDYPLKVGAVAPNSIDARERARARRSR